MRVADTVRLDRPAGTISDIEENFQVLCDRRGSELGEVAFFSFTDRRSLYLRLRSSLATAFAMLSPRFHSTFLASVKPKWSCPPHPVYMGPKTLGPKT